MQAAAHVSSASIDDVVDSLSAAPAGAAPLRAPWVPAALLVMGTLLSGCQSRPGGDVAFAQHDVVIGTEQHQTVLTGFLLDGEFADLAVVHIDEAKGRHVRMYAFADGVWSPRLEAALRPDVSFVDVANIDGRDRLITYAPGHLNWFDPESETERTLVAATSDFNPPRDDIIPHVDVTRDVNRDGRDDLVVPYVHGFHVFVQMENGAFADPVELSPDTGLARFYGDIGYRYDPWVERGRFHEVDYDLDGRTDLVFWNEDHFEVQRQDEHGLFTPTVTLFTTDVAFESDDHTWLAAPHGVRGRRMDHMPIGHMSGSVLHSLTDVNGDGVADLVVFSLQVDNMWSAESAYEVHFGTPTPDGGTSFSCEVGTAIYSDGLPINLGSHDFNRDGQLDMMFTNIKVGVLETIGMLVSAVLTDSVPIKLEFYRMAGNTYPFKPSATRKTKTVDLGTSGERASISPSILFGDVNGDGLSDMLLQHARSELRIYLGVSGPALFAKQPHRVAIDVPNEEYTWLADLNRDGRQDVLLHHPSTTEPHRVTILIAK